MVELTVTVVVSGLGVDDCVYVMVYGLEGERWVGGKALWGSY